ncbi:hypothetical protein ASPVEDRAFT_889679 [Aspergillus versicolor CBS 583.65]|uniref:Methyltransferase type 11 domain-containing protein n=1 Tax=Aspergillus versicolor CBS 583.65 TaxID=1036611 RepID=A0A1L9PNM3_ASPVE|nr:uncharacterized protein ASPVEDRAFT_889679 [Aspergillus versicolor CBS 583.65]OJJ03124.1 hypothetical protein ASPVEDRAFT_889679 [Aspergillus versicolor CBS 583.65]
MTVYITDHSTSVLKTHSWRTASNSASYLLSHITPTSKILEIGCGVWPRLNYCRFRPPCKPWSCHTDRKRDLARRD